MKIAQKHLIIAMLLFSPPLHEFGLSLSFGHVQAYQLVTSPEEDPIPRAEAEYRNHQNEGLLRLYPHDGHMIQTALLLAAEVTTLLWH